jgi:spermidine synthase
VSDAPTSEASPRSKAPIALEDVRSSPRVDAQAPHSGHEHGAVPALSIALVVATCGLVYELLAGTVASWVLGDTVGQFAVVIGLYLGAMGLGSYLSGRVRDDVATRFVIVELALAVVGGLSVPLLFMVFERVALFRAALYSSVLVIGALVGMEIPLLLRVLGERESFRSAVARVLAFDHLGSLLGSIAFAFVLAPTVGALRTGLLIGALNAVAAFASTWALEPVRGAKTLRAISVAIVCVLVALALYAPVLERSVDSAATLAPSTRLPVAR